MTVFKTRVTKPLAHEHASNCWRFLAETKYNLSVKGKSKNDIRQILLSTVIRKFKDFSENYQDLCLWKSDLTLRLNDK